MKIMLSRYNRSGSVAEIEDWDMGTIQVAVSRTKANPRAVCRSAAAQLRVLAMRFEELADSDAPLACDTQKRVNAMSIKKLEEARRAND